MPADRSCWKVMALAGWVALFGLVFCQAQANVVVFQEPFDTDTPDRATTVATYTNLSWGGSGDAVVQSGVLSLGPPSQDVRTPTGFAGDLVIQAKAGSDPGGGSGNVGLRIGGNRLIFHPAYTGGAFRVDGPNGFGNQNMGFTPAGGGTLHQMQVIGNGASGLFLISVVEANDPSRVFTASFTNPGYSPGTDQIGVTRSASTSIVAGTFDDLIIGQMPNETWTSEIYQSNPLHWYRFEETGSQVAVDFGSGQLHGLYEGGAELGQGEPGLVGNGVRFDGVDDRILLGGSRLSSTTPWTAEFIVDKLAAKTYAMLLTEDDFGSDKVNLRLDQSPDSQVGFTRQDVADYRFSPPVYAPVDEFIHLTFAGDPSSGVDVYINGEHEGHHSAFVELPRWYISRPESSYTLNAILDEVVLYDRLLSPQEILNHYKYAFSIPEPASVILFSLGGLALVLWRRRRQPAG